MYLANNAVRGSVCRYRKIAYRSWRLPYAIRAVGSDVKLFDKILIANRGEIACRVIRTAKKLGVRTVAVYSDADSKAKHVGMADEAYRIGPAVSEHSYLDQDKLLEVARACGAQAIHPGYGFLSENYLFAQKCKDAGMTFIGPPPSAIESMGTKVGAKEIMSSSSVPIIPGYYGNDQSDSRLEKEAEAIGYPVLLKADRGGGGKGMRIVESSDEFQTMLNQCRSEARNFFSDDKMLIEKYITKPRHVEVQVFADHHGNAVHLFERDCSVQRRHQKIIEEAPAPMLELDVRQKLWDTAVRAAKAVGYVGAGTVEFIMDEDHQFYFMEMNTRLQVEHPVTEMITGTDLVEWQLKVWNKVNPLGVPSTAEAAEAMFSLVNYLSRVASGGVLPCMQEQIVQNGHAFEARICAEDPDQNFMPSPGRLHHYQPPMTSDTIRIDTGVGQGDVVTDYYDSMISKLVVWDKDRQSALRKLQNCLAQYQIAGLKTNKEFVACLAGHPSFQRADVHTGFIPQHQDTLFAAHPALTPQQLALAALSLLCVEASHGTANDTDPYSPFSANNGDRINLSQRRMITLQSSQGQDTIESHEVEVEYHPDTTYSIIVEGNGFLCSAHLVKDKESYIIHGNLGDSFFTANIAIIDRTMHVFYGDHNYTVMLPLPDFFHDLGAKQVGGAKTPAYSSRVTKVLVKPGDQIKKGDILVTVEGMKLETNILAQDDGVIAEVLVSEGETVPSNSSVIQYQS